MVCGSLLLIEMAGFQEVWLGLGGFCDLILDETFQKICSF